MDEIDLPDRPFDNILNFRDVGVYINQLCGSRVLKEGILFRGARPDNASKRDQERLTDELHLASVIDLRTTTEHTIAANRRLAQLNEAEEEPLPAVQTRSATNDEHLVNLPGVRRFLLNLAGWNLEKTLLWRLSWYHFFKVLSLVAAGYRKDATKLVIEHSMVARGLKGLAHDTLTASQPEVKELFGFLSSPAGYPTFVHCTQGKDRTGLVIMLLLLLVNSPRPEESKEEGDVRGVKNSSTANKIPLSAITSDYRISEGQLLPELEERLEEMREMGLPEDFAKCPDGFVEDVMRFLEEGYGGIRGYLSAAGVDDETVEKVRGLLEG
ncbi:hypothetical protein AJ79_07088 [Helicocarpus griseus UAMH5409]|uniref:Tyrosine specific protein phosphatases domain-containing protein n=1 Tax=Helicocarpus griseus UAMH5409 TaxID=1447875 RepID=A0A2B7X6P4_9EURO|nr:hypothetical protein AJ79_07088 [Helicocarpus griseus UAMH5409]